MRFCCTPVHMNPIVIVIDYKYYIDNEQYITEWCDKCVPGWHIAGMLIEFKSEEDRVAFLLRWS